MRGSSQVLKQGTKAKNIRSVDGDYGVDCKVEGCAMALKACFVKKSLSAPPQPFTAPLVSPVRNSFCRSRNNASTGAIDTKVPDITSP